VLTQLFDERKGLRSPSLYQVHCGVGAALLTLD
jgi:hypothetical protein